jgi:hypothetical protein
MQWRMWRWSYLPLLLFIFILLFVITSRVFGLGGSILHPCPCCHVGSTLGPSPVLQCPQSFTVDTVGFPPHHILR